MDRILIANQRAKCPVRLNKYIPHLPTPKQQVALALNDVLELFYGGAAGGGKTDYLLIAGLQYVDLPGYAALILMRSFADLSLPKAGMARAREWLAGTGAHWSDETKTWHFPGGGTLTFGYLQDENDKYHYKTSEFQFIGFDELTQFSESQYTYLFSRLRRLAGVEIPLRMRATSNPDGDGLEWVKKRFIPDRFIEREDAAKFDEVWHKGGRAFVPSRLEDNRHLDQAEYEEALARLDDVSQARLRHGDWMAEQAGDLIKSEWFGDDKFLPVLPDGCEWQVRAWDLAVKDKELVPDKKKSDPDYHASVAACQFHDDLLLGRPLIWRSDWDEAVDQMERVMRIEPALTHGTGAANHETAAVQSLRRRGLNLVRYDEIEDKVSRALPWIREAKRGHVRLVGTREQWSPFLYWWWRFPRGAHKDPVDCTSGVSEMLKFPSAREKKRKRKHRAPALRSQLQAAMNIQSARR